MTLLKIIFLEIIVSFKLCYVRRENLFIVSKKYVVLFYSYMHVTHAHQYYN